MLRHGRVAQPVACGDTCDGYMVCTQVYLLLGSVEKSFAVQYALHRSAQPLRFQIWENPFVS